MTQLLCPFYRSNPNAFNEINSYLQTRFLIHLRGKSQRPYRVPQGRTLYDHLHRLGWVHIKGNVSAC